MEPLPEVIVVSTQIAIGVALFFSGVFFSLVGQLWASRYVEDRNNAGALFGFIFGIALVPTGVFYFVSIPSGVACTIGLLWLTHCMMRMQRGY